MDICKGCGCDKSLTNDKTCPICGYDKTNNGKWDRERIEETESLRDLIDMLSDLNGGSHFLESVKLCIEMARELNKTDLNNPKPSFMEFLTNKAYGE